MHTHVTPKFIHAATPPPQPTICSQCSALAKVYLKIHPCRTKHWHRRRLCGGGWGGGDGGWWWGGQYYTHTIIMQIHIWVCVLCGLVLVRRRWWRRDEKDVCVCVLCKTSDQTKRVKMLGEKLEWKALHMHAFD